MSIQITIHDVPEKVRDKLAARRCKASMQEYLRAELERLASRPAVDTWLEQVRKSSSVPARMAFELRKLLRPAPCMAMALNPQEIRLICSEDMLKKPLA